MEQLQLASGFRAFTVMAVAATLLLPAYLSQPQAQDWIVDADTTLTGERRDVSGRLVVRDGATLRLTDTELRLGSHILVEKGATLRIESSSGQGSRLVPLNIAKGFMIFVDGTIESFGPGRSSIQGLSGAGVASIVARVGGLQVNGTAILRSIDVGNGTGGLIVGEAGRIRLEDAVLNGVGEVGVAGYGDIEIERSRIERFSFIAVTAQHTCNIKIRNSTIIGGVHAAFTVGCPLEVDHAVLTGAKTAIAVSYGSNLTIRDSRFENYTVQGIAATRDVAGSAPTRVYVENLTLVPGTTATDGMELLGVASALVRNSTLSGHRGKGPLPTAGNGILSSTSNLTVVGSRLADNGKYGILAVGGNLIIAENEWGTVAENNTNGRGPVRHQIAFLAGAIDETGNSNPGLKLSVLDKDGNGIFTGNDEGRPEMQVVFEAYGTGKERPAWKGPFTYVAHHPHLETPKQGTLGPLYNKPLAIQVPSTIGGEGDSGFLEKAKGWLPVAGAALLAVLVLGVLFAKPLARLVGRGDKSAEAGTGASGPAAGAGPSEEGVERAPETRDAAASSQPDVASDVPPATETQKS